MATLIKADGGREKLVPANGKKFKLEEMQKAVGGYLEKVRLAPGNGHRHLFCNEEGKLKKLRYNVEATRLMDPAHMRGDYIAGDALLCEPGEA